MFPFVAPGKAALDAPSSADTAALLARAPGLKEAGDRIALSLEKSLQKMAGNAGSVDAVVHGLAYRDMAEVVAAHGPSSVVGLVTCQAVPCTMLVSLDALVAHGLVELLCGGNGRELAPSTPRDATAIDRQFVQIAITLLAGAVETEWADDGFGKASATRLDALAIDLFGPRVREVGCLDIKLSVFGIVGHVRICLPPVALDRFASGEPVDEREVNVADGLWSSLLRKEVGQAPVRLDAYLEASDTDLAALAALKVGQIIALPANARSRASLIAQGHLLFRGEVGQEEDRYSLRIDDVMTETLGRVAVRAPSPLRFPTEPSRS